MTMQLSILLSADAKQAKAEVAAIEGALAKMGKTAGTADSKTKGLTKSTTTLDAAVDQAKRNVQQLSAAEVRNAATAGRMGAANNAAAGQVGNLAAQFNDIGVMLAAGQNPLQLAIQQGTQITQVIGPMGAAGAAHSLKAALVSMVSPVSLITLGTIAAGAATIQWLTSAGEEAQDVVELLSELETAVKGYVSAAELASSSSTDLLAKFGTADPVMRQLLQDMVALEKVEAYRSIDAVSQSLHDMFDGFQGEATNIAQFFGKGSLDLIQKDFRDTVNGFATGLNILRDTTDQGERLRTALNLRDILLENTGGIEGMNAEQSEFFRSLLNIIREMETLGAKVAQNEAGVTKVVTSAQALLEKLQSEANIRQLITQYGEDSRRVAEAKVTAERNAFIELQNSKEISEDLKTELIAAWDAANGIASVDMAGNIALATNEAGRLMAALNSFTALNPITPKMQDEDALFSQPVLSTAATRNQQRQAVTNFNRIIAPKKTGGGGGGGGIRGKISAAQREQKAVDDLIASLTKQRDVIAETDPVQKEMIQNRKVLAKATDAERKTVEDLIAARIAEEAATEQATERADFYGNVMSSALEEATRKGASLDDVLKNIAGSFIDAGIQAAIFGEGPFGSIFGGSSILDVIFPQKKADGGMIYGAGGPRDDKVPVLASPGEFMVNARATARNRHLLEAMNAGGRGQALAAGGMIGGGSAPSAASGMGGGNVIHLHYDLTGARGNTEIIEAVKEGIEQGLREYDREVLPGRVMEISENPRMVG